MTPLDHPFDMLSGVSVFVVNSFELGRTLAGIAEKGGSVERMEPLTKHHEQWRLAVSWTVPAPVAV